MRRSHWQLVVAAMTLTTVVSSTAAAQEPSDFVECTVRIEHASGLRDGVDLAPTAEEASDLAIENACALECTEGNDDSDEEAADGADETAGDEASEGSAASNADGASAETPGETVATDDPEGVEACIDSCASRAIVIGTRCIDAKGATMYVDGAFDPEAANDDDDSDDDDDDDEDED